MGGVRDGDARAPAAEALDERDKLFRRRLDLAGAVRLHGDERVPRRLRDDRRLLRYGQIGTNKVQWWRPIEETGMPRARPRRRRTAGPGIGACKAPAWRACQMGLSSVFP